MAGIDTDTELTAAPAHQLTSLAETNKPGITVLCIPQDHLQNNIWTQQEHTDGLPKAARFTSGANFRHCLTHQRNSPQIPCRYGTVHATHTE